MRLLLLVFKLGLGIALSGHSLTADAAASHKKSKHMTMRLHAAHVKGISKHHKPLRSVLLNNSNYRPEDVWDRIRMGMQTYKLTDRFIFQANANVRAETSPLTLTLDSLLPGTGQLLMASAVQMRFYKLQKFNTLENQLHKPTAPVIVFEPKIQLVRAKLKTRIAHQLAHNHKPKLPKQIKEPAAIVQVIAPQPASNCDPALRKASFKSQTALGGEVSALMVKPGIFAPVETLPMEVLERSAMNRLNKSCKAKYRRAVLNKPGQMRFNAINYYVKAANPAQQEAVDARINREVNWFVKRPEYLQLVAERARPYLFHIVDELSKHKLPLELALLPIVESAYKPTAKSPMSAAGLWQFIPSTGKAFNLKQSGFYDERLDVTASTQAAISFLSHLSKHYKGDWLLALAAYNCGPGKVDAARRQNIAQGLPADYWSLNLPEETQNYVPRLLALANIFANPSKYQLKVKPIKNEPYFVKVNFDRQDEITQLVNKDLKAVAEWAELNYEQFNRLNPGYVSKKLTTKGPFSFILPVGNAYQLQRRIGTLSTANNKDQHLAFLTTESAQTLDVSMSSLLETVLARASNPS